MNAMAMQIIVYIAILKTTLWVVLALALGGAFVYGVLTLVRLNRLLKRKLAE